MLRLPSLSVRGFLKSYRAGIGRCLGAAFGGWILSGGQGRIKWPPLWMSRAALPRFFMEFITVQQPALWCGIADGLQAWRWQQAVRLPWSRLVQGASRDVDTDEGSIQCSDQGRCPKWHKERSLSRFNCSAYFFFASLSAVWPGRCTFNCSAGRPGVILGNPITIYICCSWLTSEGRQVWEPIWVAIVQWEYRTCVSHLHASSLIVCLSVLILWHVTGGYSWTDAFFHIRARTIQSKLSQNSCRSSYQCHLQNGHHAGVIPGSLMHDPFTGLQFVSSPFAIMLWKSGCNGVGLGSSWVTQSGLIVLADQWVNVGQAWGHPG